MSQGDGILCPRCGGYTEVIETRQNRGSLRRRRGCLDELCGGRLTTIEVPAPRFSKRVPFDDIVVMPARRASELEVVPRVLMDAVRDLMRVHDASTPAPEEHW